MRTSAVALLAVAVAMAWPQQGPGWEENSHYLGARAIANGRAEVDDDRRRIGQLSTADLAFHDGHYYMDKAPGLALVTAPVFATLRAAGMRTEGDPTHMLWALGLVGTVAPAVLLLLLVLRRTETFAPGLGVPVAVTLGLGTLLLPFATLFFSHALSAFLGFAAFVLAWRARAGPLALAAAAGAVAAFAATTEYPNGLLAIVLGVYVATGASPRLRRAAAYAGGVAAGAVPLLVYNQWAFGSPFHISYESSVSGGEAMAEGFYGITFPSARALLEMTFSEHGLLVLAPALAAALAGLVPFWRRRRAEAAVVVAILLLYAGYAAGYFNPFGGLWPGPRYLVFVLPFLALPLAEAFRRQPLATGALALVGIANMVAMTGTHAHAAYHSRWFARIAEREFATTAATVAGVTGWYAIVPFFAAALVAVVVAARALRPSVDRRAVALAVAALATWLLLFATAQRRSELGGPGLDYASYWMVGVAAALAAIVAAAIVWRRPARAASLAARR